MARLTTYTFITLNGFYKGLDEDISWHAHGQEETRYSVDSLAEGNILLFGRRTYEQMAAFWPTKQAAEQSPQVTDGMNRAEKIVFSRTPFTPEWKGTRCVAGDVVTEVRSMKEAGGNMTVLGSGSIVRLLANHGLVDRYDIMLDPVAIGRGTSLFDDIQRKLELQLVDHRVFNSGTVLLRFTPANDE